jgi:ubiquinone/menaquinone biosynthesis C-methylase UbiE
MIFSLSFILAKFVDPKIGGNRKKKIAMKKIKLPNLTIKLSIIRKIPVRRMVKIRSINIEYVGTGRGLHAIGFAKALEKCKVIGIDVWSQTSLSGNRMEKALENAKIEGVSEKVEFKNADARELPFLDEYFDVVVCSFVLHNIGKN